MVLDYYKLREQPFGVTPDFRYLYSSATHREALASLLYGVEAGRGFAALIAKPGMGKTTLLFQALHQLRDTARTVFLFQTMCTPEDFLRAILADLGIQEAQGSLIELQSKLNEVLVEQSRLGKPLVIAIDEAQNLHGSVLEQVRMLSNFETSREKLLQIILSGQPQFAEKLASPELVQLRQRISILASLKPFSPAETNLYMDHRLQTAGYGGPAPLFTSDAVALIADCGGGIPRNINNLCFNALSLGCAMQRRTIDCGIVREVVADLDLEPLRESGSVRQPEKEGGRGNSAFVSAAKALATRKGRRMKLAVVAAVLLVLAGAGFASHQWLAPNFTARANSLVSPRVSLASSVRADPNLQPVVSTAIIRVSSGQTLHSICVEHFGSCNPEFLREIHKLNPKVRNLDRIQSGQRLRIPVAQVLSGATQTIPNGQNGNAPPAERGMQ